MGFSQQKFDPDRVIDYRIDYYAVLGLERGCLPEGRTTEEREQIMDILDAAYGRCALQAHPDLGGSAEAFKLVVRAHTILSHFLYRRIYESGGAWRPSLAEDATGFEVDWSKIGTYQSGTLADTVGFGLCLNITARADELGLVPAFVPSAQEHNYEWDWAFPESGAKLALAIVEDEEEVARLTTGAQILADTLRDTLPFKIYLCIPRAALYFLRGEPEQVVYEDGTTDEYVMNGRLQAALYSDYDLLETTSLQEARQYVAPGGGLERHLAQFRDGTLVAAQAHKDKIARQHQWVSSEEMKRIDAQVLRQILKMKSRYTIRDERAADFLQHLPDNDIPRERRREGHA